MNFLDEIRRNAGEVQNESKISKKPYTGTVHSYMFEMAAADLTADVIGLLKNGKPVEAAEAYQGKPGGIATTIKGLFKKDPNFDKQVLLDFAKAVKPDISKSSYQGLEDTLITGEVKNRKAVKGSEGPGGLRTSSQSTQKTIKKAIDKIYKIRQEVLAQAKQAEQDGDEESERKYVSQLEGLDALLQSAEYVQKSGKGVIEGKPEKMKQRYNKIAKEFKAKFGTEYNIPKLPSEKEEYDPKDAEEALRNLSKRRAKRYDPFSDDEDMETPVDYYDPRTQDRLKKELEKEKEEEQDESLNLKGKILAEGLEYKGSYFWKNYIMTSLMKSFSKDLEIFGEDTKFLYAEAYGLMAYPIFEYMQENEKVLNEVVKIDKPLLFEEYGYNAIMEIGPATAANLAAGGGLSGTQRKVGFLRGLWDKIKNFGGPLVDKLSGALGAGLSWVKNLTSNGLSWLASNPIAQVAIPAVVLTGSAIGAVKLINRLRRKSGERKMSKQEVKQLKQAAAEKSDIISKQTKAIKSAKPVKPTERDAPDTMDDDERDILSDEEL